MRSILRSLPAAFRRRGLRIAATLVLRAVLNLAGLAALLPVLNEEQKTQLLLAAKAGNSEARAQMIQGNLRLVLSVVQKFAGRGENLDDLFQVGCIGLIKAIDNFDAENHDVRFSTYGVPMISGEIRRYLRDNSPIRVSRSTHDTAYKLSLIHI